MDPKVKKSYPKLFFAVIILLVVIIILLFFFLPVVPFTVYGGCVGCHVRAFGSLSYILTGQGETYSAGHYYWGTPPIA